MLSLHFPGRYAIGQLVYERARVMQSFRSLLLLRRSKFLLASAIATLPCLPLAVRAFINCTITGPTPTPYKVALNTTYTLTVNGTPATNDYIYKLELYGCGGTRTAPNGNWLLKGTVTGTGLCGVGAFANFNVVNQSVGDFWWKGEAYRKVCTTDIENGSAFSDYIGSYYTS
jgi:hypothetical protein